MSEPEIVHRLIIPPEEAGKLVAQAGRVYLRECPCRTEMQVCPREEWEVCLLFEHASADDRQQAKLITPDEAVNIVRLTTERGDIHQVFYFEDGARPFELCNCCTCCCFPLREAEERGDYGEQLRCGYVATTDAASCIGCGSCLESCFFEARQLEGGALRLIDERCFGCGRCIADCPEGAIRLEFHAGRGVPIPSL
ncbi:MAG: 4Fe-4S binding protein [Anaerolineae bacterium]|nr:4Fe-4S binding protein [Anaerolineae bacterium]